MFSRVNSSAEGLRGVCMSNFFFRRSRGILWIWGNSEDIDCWAACRGRKALFCWFCYSWRSTSSLSSAEWFTELLMQPITLFCRGGLCGAFIRSFLNLCNASYYYSCLFSFLECLFKINLLLFNRSQCLKVFPQFAMNFPLTLRVLQNLTNTCRWNTMSWRKVWTGFVIFVIRDLHWDLILEPMFLSAGWGVCALSFRDHQLIVLIFLSLLIYDMVYLQLRSRSLVSSLIQLLGWSGMRSQDMVIRYS